MPSASELPFLQLGLLDADITFCNLVLSKINGLKLRRLAKSTLMTVREALAEGRIAMKLQGNSTPELDTALLLANACKLDREQLYMRLSESLDSTIVKKYRLATRRRISGEPVAWIIGRKEFWGRNISVGPGVFCPRPDTEALIEVALKTMDEYTPEARLHDCCCGPGTLALTLAAERPGWSISASDISPIAEKYFEKNNLAISNGKVKYFHSNLLKNVPGNFEVIVSNPPYLTPAEFSQQKKWKEPALALNGGDHDGLKIIRRLIPHAWAKTTNNGALLLEVSPTQMDRIFKLLTDTGFKNIQYHKDLGGSPRVAIAKKEAI